MCERKICNRCKVNLLTSEFNMRRNGEFNKLCNRCLEKAKGYNKKSKCEHGKRREICKECGGSGICEHGKRREICKECGGSSICNHKRQRSQCKECEGASICEHKRLRVVCKECEGSSICVHKKQRSHCKECQGSSFCEHKIQCSKCKECFGSSICDHKRMRSQCKICDPAGHMISIARSRIWKALKSNKKKHSVDYFGTENMVFYRSYIEAQFVEGMTWENYGAVWHIDHRIPIRYNNPTDDEICDRLHFTNTQPMFASENMAKGNRYIK